MPNHLTTDSTLSGCRHMLTVVRTALDIPAPATVADEAGYYAVLTARVTLARAALARVLRGPSTGTDEYLAEAQSLQDALAGHSPVYGHHPLGS